LLNELFNLLKTDFQKIGILARNWRGEINKIQRILKSSQLDEQGFEISWEQLDDDLWKQSDESDKKNRRKMFLHRGTQEIEVLNIHTAKGREWDKVILLVNTMYNSFPDRRNDPTNERRLFYVAVTRAKQELIILQSGDCQFIPEFRNIPITKENLEEVFREELAVREPKLKIELEESSKAALATLVSRRKKETKKASKIAREKYQPDLNRLHHKANEIEKEVNKIEAAFTEKLKASNHEFLEELIEGLMPVLDTFDIQTENLSGTGESNNVSDDFVGFTESVQLAQTQLLDLLKNNGLRPIETLGEIFNPTYHEEIQPAIYSNEVKAGWVAREERRGYLLYDQVIRKAQVLISKGENIRSADRLDQVVEIYLNRLIHFKFGLNFQFGTKYDLDKPTIKGKMAKYLAELDEESLKKINEAATIDPVQYIGEQISGDYCAGQATTYMCTDVVFRNFWDYMWKVIEQSTKTPISKIKPVQPSGDKPSHASKTGKSTSVKPSPKIGNRTSIWNELETAHETGTSVKGYIIKRVKGGLRVKVGSLPGFLPASQVGLRPPYNLEQYVGQTLDMKIIDLNRQRHNIVFSRQAWLEEHRIKLLNTLEVGQHVTGMVKNITSFGAFVDLDGIDGLLHKSEMSWKHVSHPSKIVSIGEEIEVKVTKIDREDEKISLSLKQTTSNPWENVEDKYPIGSKVKGLVVNIVDFGAFVQLEEGIVGLVHVSEMPLVLNNVLPLDILNEDDELEVTVLEISKDSQRISLSTK
ncbi:nucleotide exchange factor GrpE, partial [Candidatus Poribacteria bacterium]|nr:nucleotide exchange factor GrpE [Candidatus Poribacteria bacterium]